MRVIPYAEKQIVAESGTHLDLSYSILVIGSDNEPERYGVRITEKNSGHCAQAADLTMDSRRIYDLLEKLVRNNVTPTGLVDVIADWL
jgi:hypothetical protein